MKNKCDILMRNQIGELDPKSKENCLYQALDWSSLIKGDVGAST